RRTENTPQREKLLFTSSCVYSKSIGDVTFYHCALLTAVQARLVNVTSCFVLAAGFVKQCIKYDDCNKETLKARFPQMTGATSFYCCNRNLCNGTPSTTLTSPVLLILAAAFCLVI
uniref:UPAR/Ly6 domain-containing protein n=1 Tax=Erpetoichthys calabaricus TaxID=27687 RepID=A0A8C4RTV8_ERPCA